MGYFKDIAIELEAANIELEKVNLVDVTDFMNTFKEDTGGEIEFIDACKFLYGDYQTWCQFEGVLAIP
jgi:hypothetical protein